MSKPTENTKGGKGIVAFEPDPEPEQPVEPKKEIKEDIQIEKIERKDVLKRKNGVDDQIFFKTVQPGQDGERDEFREKLKEAGAELVEVGEITKEEHTLKECKVKLREMIQQLKGIEISEQNIEEIIEQVDKSCLEEIIDMKMRIEWERIFLKFYNEIRDKVSKYSSLKIDLEKSRIVLLEDKSSDYDIVYEDKEIDESMKRYGTKKIGRGLHARCILELLVYNDIKKSLTEGMNIEEAFSKYTKEKIGEVWINYGEQEKVMEYREAVIYAFLAILEAHNLGIKEIEDGINGEGWDKEQRISYENEGELIKEEYR